MASITRIEFLKSRDNITGQIFLLTGERFLCKQTALQLCSVLQEQGSAIVNRIDGNEEEPARTLSRLQSFSLLSEKQIYLVTDTHLFHSKIVAHELWQKAVDEYHREKEKRATKNLHAFIATAQLSIDSQNPLSELSGAEWRKLFSFDKPQEDLQWADAFLFQSRDEIKQGNVAVADSYRDVFTHGLPAQNIVILLAETVDKRHRLYSWIKKNALIVDCSVVSGSSAAAQKEQKGMLREMAVAILAEFGKKIEPACVDLFFERVGVEPAMVTNETEKLVYYTGERSAITVQDVEAVVSQNREGALYELTDALGKRDLARTITVHSRLLDQGVYPLAILATLRNYVRKHLVFRVIQLSSHWNQNMQAREFQYKYLPVLKENEQWKGHLGGHPYALYINFTVAGKLSLKGHKNRLRYIVEAEYRLKSSSLSPKLILEELIMDMFYGKRISKLAS